MWRCQLCKKGAPVVMACPHHWICDTPNGPVSKSRCRLCGEEKEFQNHLGGEQAERLPYEGGAAYLPEQRPVTRLEVTEEPDLGSMPRDAKCHHYWESGDPDEQGIAHVRCTRCPQEYWMDVEGNLYDSQKNMLTQRQQGIQPGETVGRREGGANVGKGGQTHSKHAEYMRRWPEILKELQETSFEAAVGKFGIPSGTLYGLLRRAGLNRQGQSRKPTEQPVSTEKPKHGGNNFAKSVALRPVREKAEVLFRQGKCAPEVQRALAQEFGEIPIGTLNGWMHRMKPGTPVQQMVAPADMGPTQDKHSWLNETMTLLGEMEAERKDLSTKAAEITNQIEQVSRGITGLNFIIQRYAEKHGNPTK
jgi:hypothetical protein